MVKGVSLTPARTIPIDAWPSSLSVAQEIDLKEFQSGYINIFIPAKSPRGQELFLYVVDPTKLNNKIKNGFIPQRVAFNDEKVEIERIANSKPIIETKSYLLSNLGMEIHDSSGKKMSSVKPDNRENKKWVDSVILIGMEPRGY